MTGIDRPPHPGGSAPMGPPWPVDVLADLHAGVLEPAVAQQLWPRVRQDADAVAVLDALDATRAELSGLAAAPPIPMPAHLAARLDAAIAAESAHRTPPVRVAPPPPPPPMPVAPVIDLARARRKRNQRLGWAAGVLVAAAAVAVAVISIPRGATPGTPGSSTAAGPLALHSGQINGTTLAAAIGHTDYGPLSDPARRRACLAANDIDPSVTPAGVMRVTLDGTPGVLFVLPTGELARYRLLVVGDDCAAGDPAHLAESVVGGIPATPTR